MDEGAGDFGNAVRIGIDGEGLRRPLSGVGHYLYNLCCELDRLMPEATFFVYARLPAQALALPTSMRWQLRREPNRWLRRVPSFLWLKTRGAHMCRRDRLDVFWAGRTIHAGTSAARRLVVTIHDFNHRIVPETMELATRISHRLFFDRDVRSAHTVLANSQGTDDRLWHFLRRRTDAVIRPGLSERFRPIPENERLAMQASLAALNIVPPYVLAVSTLEPRKNIEALLDAYVELRERDELKGHRLVLVGARGWQNERLAAKVRAAAKWGVVLPGYVADELMPAVYGYAEVLVMPSLYEGFGMPVLEARSMGTPVITTDVPELREAAGADGGLVGADPKSIAAALLKVRESTRRAPDVSPDTHGWAGSAQTLVEALRRTLGTKHDAAN